MRHTSGLNGSPPKASTLLDVAEGIVDLALLPDAMKRPDGIATTVVGQFQWASFMRKDHPATRNWGKKAWSAWPHIVVGTGGRLSGTVSTAAEAAKLKRSIGIVVPNFGVVAPLLAQTNMIATLPLIVLTDALQRFDLQIHAIPFHVPAMSHAIAWSARLTSDPASLWLRACFLEVIQTQIIAADNYLS